MAIMHSELTKALLPLKEMDSEEERIKQVNAIISMTSGGVHVEAAMLNQKVAAPKSQSLNEVGLNLGLGNSKPRFSLGAASKKELEGVKYELICCVGRAIEITTQDFTVFDGLRTEAEQRKLVQRGMSRTMNSKHLKGLAVDLVPWVDGKPTWDWKLIYPIAYAMDQAATELGYASKIRWGGAWDRVLADFGGNVTAYREEVEDYVKRHPGKDFIDGPHFEWVG